MKNSARQAQGKCRACYTIPPASVVCIAIQHGRSTLGCPGYSLPGLPSLLLLVDALTPLRTCHVAFLSRFQLILCKEHPLASPDGQCVSESVEISVDVHIAGVMDWLDRPALEHNAKTLDDLGFVVFIIHLDVLCNFVLSKNHIFLKIDQVMITRAE
jgi:hypothetical protein